MLRSVLYGIALSAVIAIIAVCFVSSGPASAGAAPAASTAVPAAMDAIEQPALILCGAGIVVLLLRPRKRAVRPYNAD